jgi:hypothetical protein
MLMIFEIYNKEWFDLTIIFISFFFFEAAELLISEKI